MNLDTLTEWLAGKVGLPYLHIDPFKIDFAAVTKVMSNAYATRFRILPVAVTSTEAVIATCEPYVHEWETELARILRLEIKRVLANPVDINSYLVEFYNLARSVKGASQQHGTSLSDITNFEQLVQLGASGKLDANDQHIVRLVDWLLQYAFDQRASDIHVEPRRDLANVRFRIDGVLHLQTEADSKIAPALVLRLKLMSGLDISEKRLPQDGRFHVDIKGNPLDVRISTMPTQYGESVVMRLLNQGTGLLSLERLGMPARMFDKVRSTLKRSSGMILVTGPTGSGKTTALYAALNEINSPDRKIITVEDPVEYRLPGINQVQVHDKIELSFERVLRAALRQDPDVILVGEMRDRTTAEIGLRAAMTGHLVLSTLHTNDAASTPVRLLDMGVPPYMVAMSLNLVIAQRLVRLVCEDCHSPHTPTPQEHAWLRHHGGEDAAGRSSYAKGLGCSRCNGTGYAGRTAVYEMLEMTQALVDAANRGSPIEFVQIAREQIGSATLLHNAMELAGSGRTTIDEAMRVSVQIDP